MCSISQAIREGCVDWAHRSSLNREVVGAIRYLWGGYMTPNNCSRGLLMTRSSTPAVSIANLC